MFSLKFGLKTAIFQAELQAAPVIPPVFFRILMKKPGFSTGHIRKTKTSHGYM